MNDSLITLPIRHILLMYGGTPRLGKKHSLLHPEVRDDLLHIQATCLGMNDSKVIAHYCSRCSIFLPRGVPIATPMATGTTPRITTMSTPSKPLAAQLCRSKPPI